MKRSILFCIALIACLSGYVNSQVIHHDLDVTINIKAKNITVTDSIKIPENIKQNGDTVKFSLNKDMTVRSLNPAYKLIALKSRMKNDTSKVSVINYAVTTNIKGKKISMLPVQYTGNINGRITSNPVDYARGFSETSGIISEEGIYLAGTTRWIPELGEALFSFNLTTTIDSAWGVISQGTRTKVKTMKDKKIIRYENPTPADEVYLVAAKWTEYNRKFGPVLVQAELRKPDTALANKYLGATIGYMAMYSKLIGPYPYTKFTLVENFWETGYGMPSFTLLGETVIRLPFIIGSSYPHELLHNYWGNSVYVDEEKGNWCEGLTVYLADHLLKEQSGQGSDYRRSTLLKFTDFVNESNDFPVTDFRSRNNSAEEAIGYGKVMMIFEMLRYELGDEAFKRAIAKFYIDNRFKITSWEDIRKSFEVTSGRDLKVFFDQWTQRKGAPTLKLSDVDVKQTGEEFQINFTLSQIQKEDPFNLKIPVIIYLENNDFVETKDIPLSKRSETYSMTFKQRPIKIDIDPQFNVFRRLDREEEPITISNIYGYKDVAMVLPKNSPYIKEYLDLAEQWKKTQEVQGNKFEVVYDSDIKELPDKPTWIVGFENKYAAHLKVLDSYYTYMTNETVEQIGNLQKTGGLVYVFPSSKNKTFTNGFIGSNNQKMIAGIKKKVMHYTKYSYLGFEGDEATNKVKGEFPVISSPLIKLITNKGESYKVYGKVPVRKSLYQ